VQLERRFPHLKIPPFPPKSYSLFGTHGPEFLDERRRGLETFLQVRAAPQSLFSGCALVTGAYEHVAHRDTANTQELLKDSRFHGKELKTFLDPTGQARH
jgi:hypothetical protein